MADPALVLHPVVLDVEAATLVASEQHQAELLREFQLISLSASAEDLERQLPGRLAALIVETLADYTAVQNTNLERTHDALARGDTTVRLEMDLPFAVVAAIEKILAALEEADTYCRRGGALLTLAAPPEVAAFRRWFVVEITRRIERSVGRARRST